MNRLCYLLLAVALSGCSNLQTYKVAAVTKVAELSDQTQADAEFMFCSGYTIGTWVRRFGNDPVAAAAWRALCLRGATEVPTPPANGEVR